MSLSRAKRRPARPGLYLEIVGHEPLSPNSARPWDAALRQERANSLQVYAKSGRYGCGVDHFSHGC